MAPTNPTRCASAGPAVGERLLPRQRGLAMSPVRRSALKRWLGVALLAAAISAGAAWGLFAGLEAAEESWPALSATGLLVPRSGPAEQPWLVERARGQEPGDRTNSNSNSNSNAPNDSHERSGMPEHPTDRVHSVPSTLPRQAAPSPKVQAFVTAHGLELRTLP